MNCLYAVIVFALSLHSSGIANSRCGVLPTPIEAFNHSKVVFIGKVIIVADPEFSAGGIPHRVVSLERQITAGFIVEKVYRGAAFEEVEVSSKSGGLEFGHDFNVGERYLVYAEGVDNAGVEELVVKGCGRTRLIKDADEDLHFLNEPSQPTETGKVHGHSR